MIFENLENRLLWKTIVIQKGLFELSAFWKLGGLWRAFLCFWRHLPVKRLLHLDFFLVQQPLFRFLQLPTKWELHALSFLSPLCECVAGSQIGHLLCEDCKFLIHVRRCHTTRITRKASPPCVPAGKTVQWTIFVKGTYRIVTKCDHSLSLRCKETK